MGCVMFADMAPDNNSGCARGCGLLLLAGVIIHGLESGDWSGLVAVLVVVGVAVAIVAAKRAADRRRVQDWLAAVPSRLAGELPPGEVIERTFVAVVPQPSPAGPKVRQALVGLSRTCVVVATVDSSGQDESMLVYALSGLSTWKREGVGNGSVVTLSFEGGSTLSLAMPASDAQEFTHLLSRVLDGRGRSAVPACGSVSEELQQLHALHVRGILTAEDWEAAKRNLIGAPRDRVVELTASLEQLHTLMKRGVLSEGEFNMKKWDLLSR